MDDAATLAQLAAPYTCVVALDPTAAEKRNLIGYLKSVDITVTPRARTSHRRGALMS